MEAKKTKIVILAGGKGTRMQNDLPKVLMLLRGEPMIKYLLKAVLKTGIFDRPCIVVGYQKEKVMAELGPEYDYVVQEEQLGTGHAVMCAEKIIADKADNVMVLYGDHPFVSPETIKNLIHKHEISGGKITMATIPLPDFEDWRAFFYTNFSRIIRNQKGEILKDVQFKDTTEEEKEVREVNPCYYCFDAKWLWENLKKLNRNNAQKEYYLTDLIKIAMQEGIKIESISIDAHEGLGINSKAELDLSERFAP